MENYSFNGNLDAAGCIHIAQRAEGEKSEGAQQYIFVLGLLTG